MEAAFLEWICPICNALFEIERSCPVCDGSLKDGGAVQDYQGPYSPYMGELLEPDTGQNQCVHLLYCAVCGYDVRAAWPLVLM